MRYKSIPTCMAVVLTTLFCCACDQNTGGGGVFGGPSNKGDAWAIRCIAQRGKDHMQYANAYGESLKKVHGLRPELVQVVHDLDVSTVYYGRYAPQFDDVGNVHGYVPDCKGDIALIKSLSFSDNNFHPFALLQMEPLPGAGTGKPEWNLANANGYWSLQVAVFYNTKDMTERRQAAEDYCKLLREQGEEAYYHHGPDRSSVCIGTYPYDAITQSSEEDPFTGKMTVKAKITNKNMLDAQKRFPNNLENGFVVYNVSRDAGGAKRRDPNLSFPVLLPRAERKAQLR